MTTFVEVIAKIKVTYFCSERLCIT